MHALSGVKNISSGVVFTSRHSIIHCNHADQYPCVGHLHGVSLFGVSQMQDASLHTGCGTPCLWGFWSRSLTFPLAEQGSCRWPCKHHRAGLSHMSLKGIWSDPTRSGSQANKWAGLKPYFPFWQSCLQIMVGVFLCRNSRLIHPVSVKSITQPITSTAVVEKGTEEKHHENSLLITAPDDLVQKDRFVSWERKQSWKEIKFQPCWPWWIHAEMFTSLQLPEALCW